MLPVRFRKLPTTTFFQQLPQAKKIYKPIMLLMHWMRLRTTWLKSTFQSEVKRGKSRKVRKHCRTIWCIKCNYGLFQQMFWRYGKKVGRENSGPTHQKTKDWRKMYPQAQEKSNTNEILWTMDYLTVISKNDGISKALDVCNNISSKHKNKLIKMTDL